MWVAEPPSSADPAGAGSIARRRWSADNPAMSVALPASGGTPRRPPVAHLPSVTPVRREAPVERRTSVDRVRARFGAFRRSPDPTRAVPAALRRLSAAAPTMLAALLQSGVARSAPPRVVRPLRAAASPAAVRVPNGGSPSRRAFPRVRPRASVNDGASSWRRVAAQRRALLE
jgi:hypothetical protein